MGIEILKEINRILERINTHPEYSACARNQITEMIRNEAIRHSASLEPEMHESRHDRDHRIKEDVLALADAHSFLAKEGVNLYTLTTLGSKIEAGECKGTLRKDVEGSGHRYGNIECPPARKIPYLIEGLVGYLNEEPLVHPVTRATNAHLNMVFIHPFEDGNGRAARLLQNFCLEQRNYPPVILNDDERERYISLLNPAIRELETHCSPYGGDGPRERAFHNFMEHKVLDSVKRMKSQLDRLRVYDVEFHGLREESNYIAARNVITNIARRTNKAVKVEQMERRNGNGARVRVIGDVGYDELNSVLNLFSKKTGSTYDIRINKC